MSPEQRACDRESESEVAETSSRAKAAPEAPHRLIEGCQGLVRTLAWKIHRKLPPNVDVEDLIAFGQVGLVEAARDFDPGRGGRFTTYAYYRIRGAILDGLSKMSWFSRLDYHSRRYEHMANEVLSLETSDGGEPSAGALEEEVGWFKGVASTLAVVYLAAGGGREEEALRSPLVDKSTPSPPAQAAEREIREKLQVLIEALPSDAGRLIRGVYFEGLTLKEAGGRLGISKAWASRLHAKTLRRLAHSLRLIGVSD